MFKSFGLISICSFGGCAAIALLVVAGLRGQAPDDDENHNHDYWRIERGFDIAPVPLNLEGKNRALVGLGSYLVNAVAGCNDCHTAQPYARAGNPYFGEHPAKVNSDWYLGGGTPFTTPAGTFVSRNLTPDRTGRPEGGHTLDEFLQIMRTGIDMDHLHPNLPRPFDSSVLQVMPWPIYQKMSDHDLRAIYEYLSAIPCVAGPTSGPLHNDCD